MCSSLLNDELYSLSFESIEEDSNNAAWFTLIQNLSYDKLEKLRDIFRKTSENGEDVGLDKEQFLNAVCHLHGNAKYSVQSNLLFEDIVMSSGKSSITWNDLLDFLVENLNTKIDQPVCLTVNKIDTVPHAKRETIVKIVLIEMEMYFCYAIISKHGRIGLYDGNLDFLTSYHVIMTREDITRCDNERRRRNRWVTDAIFCEDVQMFIVTNSARTVMIYEASGLNHVPYWLIIGLPNIPERLAYKGYGKLRPTDEPRESVLFFGCSRDVMVFKFLQLNVGLLRRKFADKINLFYWDELDNEKTYLEIKITEDVHQEDVNKIDYYAEDDSFVTCSNDSDRSLVKTYISHVKKPYIYKMRGGCSCFASSNNLNQLVTGSPNGTIRIWNSVIVSKPIAILLGHQTNVVDLEIMESQIILLSFSVDGVLKVWDLKEHRCLQTLKIKFPSFGIQGKSIEYGTNSIYPGPKRISLSILEKQRINVNKCFSMDDIIEKTEHYEESNSQSLDRWDRSSILVTCCNHIADIRLTFKDIDVEKSFEMEILPPPPLQNSVLIPSSWRIQQKVDDSIGANETKVKTDELLKSVEFILNKKLLDTEGAKSDINYKIAKLETKKLEMQMHVAKGAPYLAIDLFDIEELKLSDNLPVPNRKKIKSVIERTEKLLYDASKKDQIFSEHSSSRSRSSRSSIVEFPY